MTQAANRTEIDRLSTDREKTGVAIGADAINPVNGERIPIYIADYVLSGYGTGAIMAVPAHDERDFAFAQAFGLPIRRVVMPPDADPTEDLRAAFVEHTTEEVMVNSGSFSGRRAADAWHEIVESLEGPGKGRRAVTYRLRDWLVSRQRYWRTPLNSCPRYSSRNSRACRRGEMSSRNPRARADRERGSRGGVVWLELTRERAGRGRGSSARLSRVGNTALGVAAARALAPPGISPARGMPRGPGGDAGPATGR